MKLNVFANAYFRKTVVLSYDIVACALAVVMALMLRLNEFSDFGLYVIINDYSLLLLISVVVKMSCFYLFKVTKGMWRFTSTPDLKAIIKASLVAEVIIVAIMFLTVRGEYIPRTAFIFDAMITIYLIAGARVLYRFFKERSGAMVATGPGKKAIVIGAGNIAERLLRDFNRSQYDFQVVGLLDDQANKHGRTILGYKILGPIDSIAAVIKKHHIEKVIIGISSLSSAQVRKIVSLIADPEVEIVTLPSLKDLVDGKISVSEMRKIDVNDLLGRDPVKLEVAVLAPLVQGKVVMVTGAGGSIGSELVRQIAKLGPSLLVLFDNNEFFLYQLEQELKEKFSHLKFHLAVGDVRDIHRINQVMSEHKPEACYHAAAYKHVPMMEVNPHEAIKVNIFGTRNVLEACKNNGVKKFVLISTDKAVRPSSVMGATKKVAEMICQAYSKFNYDFKIVVVRFGNVLASHGSVVPLFMDQIKRGGPVTVTHKDMTRYFMSIPEAAQLVLNAGAIGTSGSIMILEMGEPVKIMDLARQLIQLSGFKPDVDIMIKEIGLRPGEKLFEELFYDSEKMIDTEFSKIKVSGCHEIGENYLSELNAFELKFMNIAASDIRKSLALIIASEVEDKEIHKYLQ